MQRYISLTHIVHVQSTEACCRAHCLCLGMLVTISDSADITAGQ